MEAESDETRLFDRLLRSLLPIGMALLIIDELGFVPLVKTGAEHLEVIHGSAKPCSILVCLQLAFEWATEIFGSERLTMDALLDRADLTHHVISLPELNGESFLNQCQKRRKSATCLTAGESPVGPEDLPRCFAPRNGGRAATL